MQLLNVKAPGDMEIVLDCKGRGRFVALTWLDGFNELLVNEGAQDEFGDSFGWPNFVSRPNIAEALKDYMVIGTGDKDAMHSLILDKVSRKLWVCDQGLVEEKLKLLMRMNMLGGGILETLDVPLLGQSDVQEILKDARVLHLHNHSSGKKLH